MKKKKPRLPTSGLTRTVSHDDLMKRLLEQPKLLADFFRAFLPEIEQFADLRTLEYLDKDHPSSKRRPRRSGDILVKLRWKERDVAFLIHIESQSTPQEIVLERAIEYGMRDGIRYRLLVLPIVLLTYPVPETKVSDTLRWDFGKLAYIHAKVPVLHFRLMDPEPHLRSHNLASLALASLMKLDEEQEVDLTVESLAECLRQKLSPEDREAVVEFVQAYVELGEEQQLKLNDKVHTLAKRETLLRPMPKIINPFVELGVRRGRVEGRVEGRMEGKSEAFHMLLQRQIELKFPTISRKAAPLVQKLDEEGALSLGEALLFMDSPSKCLAWLKQRE